MKRSATVADAAARISSLDDDFEPVNYVYLTNEDGRLDGVVTVRRLFIAQKDECLGDLDNGEDLIVANPDDDQEDVAENIAKYNLLAVPVVDENHKILGIVTVDDALDVLEEEHEEDLHIAGGSSSDSSSREKSGEVKRLFVVRCGSFSGLLWPALWPLHLAPKWEWHVLLQRRLPFSSPMRWRAM